MTAYEQLSDTELIGEVIRGNITVFEVLVRRYNSYLYKIGMSYRFSCQDTEDLMQETFIAAYKNLWELKDKSYFKTWLTRIMINECYKGNNKVASRKRTLSGILFYERIKLLFSGINNNGTLKKAENDELKDVIKNALEQIPSDYRLVFSLRELNGYNVMETAQILNITEINVKVRLSRAKVMLRKEVGKIYSHEEILQLMRQ